MSSDLEAPGTRRRWPYLLAVLLGLVAVGWAGVALALGSTIPEGTTISGVSVGGQSPSAAEKTLRSAFVARTDGPIAVTAGGKQAKLEPAEAGLRLDVRGSVAQVTPTAWNPLRLFGGSKTAEAVTQIDDAALASALKRVAQELDSTVGEPTITFAGDQPVLTPGVVGHSVDQAAAVSTLRSQWLTADAAVDLPSSMMEPTVGAEAAQRALNDVARSAVSAPVLVVAGPETTVPVEPATIAEALSFVVRDGALVPEVDAEVIAAAVKGKLGAAITEPKDARFTINAGVPSVLPSQPGTDVDRPRLGAVVAAVLSSPAPREVEVPVIAVPAAFTTEQATALNITEKLSSYTTKYPYAAYRLQNIHRAADIINMTLLQPGEEFSLNGIVGERTAANGFAVGVIIRGGKFAKDYGGGVSQVATTTFNSVFFAGLEDVEHRPHSFYISRYPAGREATVAWGALDLRFRNDSPDGVLLTAGYTNSSITISLYGKKRYDIDSISSNRYRVTPPPPVKYDTSATCVHQDAVSGFDIDVTRVFRPVGQPEGEVLRKENFHTRYEPAQEILCRAAPKPPASPSAAASPAASAPAAAGKPTPAAAGKPTPAAVATPKPAAAPRP